MSEKLLKMLSSFGTDLNNNADTISQTDTFHLAVLS